jgi:branched-chain amino acid transport system substrate-binding protein
MRHSHIPLALTVMLVLALGAYLVPAAPAATMGPVTDSLGVVRVNRGQPIVIAYWQVTSGPNASLGIDQRRGIEIAITDKGRVAGFSVRLIGEDSGCNAEGGVTAATKIAANRQVVAAIGSTCSSEAVPGAPILWRRGIVTVSGSNTAPTLTDPKRSAGFGGYMRTAHNDKVQGRVAGEWVRSAQKQVTLAATIHDGSPYAEGLANAFAGTFLALGGKISTQEAIAPGDTDMRPVLTKIATSKPQLLYFPVFIAEGGHIARQAKEVSGLENTILMGADGLFSPDFLKAAGDAAKGMYLSSPDLSPAALGPRYTTLLDKYKKRFGENPPAAFHAHTYDAAMMIFMAIEKVGKKDSSGNLYIGRKALRDALFATKSYRGVTGTLTCDKNGDCADPKIVVYQIVSADPAKWNAGVDPKKVSK